MSELRSAYTIITKHNIVLEYHAGLLKSPHYLNFKKKLVLDPEFKAGLNYLIHFKDIEIDVENVDIENFVNFMRNNRDTFGNRKVAFITNTPNQVVKTTLYKNMSYKSNTVEIFSTPENALYWLGYATDEIISLSIKLNQLIENKN